MLTAGKNFAWEDFGLKHRYAMVLHTDEPHPHVHLVVRAMGYDGQRLNIRKATLREWRRGVCPASAELQSGRLDPLAAAGGGGCARVRP